MADQQQQPVDGNNGQDGGTDGAKSDIPVKEYKNIVLTGFGGIRNVRIDKKPEFTPKEGEVLIRVKSCGMNFNDLMLRQGALDNPPKPPFVMGFECSGEVEALGEGVTNYKVGDAVIAITEGESSWAELVAISVKFVYKMPNGMSFQDASALLVNYLTAYLLLFDVGYLKSGQSVLVHSVGGGVGHAVCELVKTLNDVTVFGTASSGKHETIKNSVTHLFDHEVDYCQEIRKISPEGVDLVLDSLCGEDTKKGVSILKPLGRYILYGNSSIVTGDTKSFLSFAKSWWQVDKISPIDLYKENKTVCGFNLHELLFKQNQHEYVRSIVSKLFRMYKDGKIRPLIDSSWAFEDVGDAMQKMHDRKNIGKILLNPTLEPNPKPEPQASKTFNFSLSSIQSNITSNVTSKFSSFGMSTESPPAETKEETTEETVAPTQ